MPRIEDHVRQWKHNRDLLAVIPLTHPDWLATVAFYAALQAVDALLAFDHVTGINNHDARNGVLMRTNRYSFINGKYHVLYSLSRTVRYLADPTQWIPADEVEKKVVWKYLYPIEASVQKLMDRDLGLSRIVLAGPGRTPSSG